MITYLASGQREYDTYPVALSVRTSWEFQLILSGRAAPSFVARHPQPRPQGHSLWVFPPAYPHGWVSDGSCRILVAHFSKIAETVSGSLTGPRRVSLEAPDEKRLVKLFAEVEEDRRQPGIRYMPRMDLLQAELSLIALRGFPERPMHLRPEDLVQKAMGWYDTEMENGVGVGEMADYLGVNVSHLRRQFHEARGTGPQQVLREAKVARAEALLQGGGLPLTQIAHACGMGSESSLIRLFKDLRGMAPKQWVRRLREDERGGGLS